MSQRASWFELILLAVLAAAVAAVAVPAYKVSRLRSQSLEKTATLGALAQAEATFATRWGAYALASASPRRVDALDDTAIEWTATNTSAGFGVLGYAPTGQTRFVVCIVANPSAPDMPKPGDLDAKRPAIACADRNSRIETPQDADPRLLDTALALDASHDIVIHVRADIDGDGAQQGWFLTDEYHGTEIPDPLSSGEDVF